MGFLAAVNPYNGSKKGWGYAWARTAPRSPSEITRLVPLLPEVGTLGACVLYSGTESMVVAVALGFG